MRIVVLDGHTLNPGDNPWDAVASLGDFVLYDHSDDDQVLSRAAGADILVTNKTRLAGDALSALPDLKFIAVTATGYNVVDIDAAQRRGIPVANVPVYGTDSVAQFVVALLLELMHHVAQHDKAIRQGAWQEAGVFSFWQTPQIELRGRTMGLIGFGRIGRRVGELAHALGMDVRAATRTPVNPPAYEGFSWATTDQVFEQSDVVSLHCPLTDENKQFVDANLLATMKPSAFLINTARGGLIDEAALAQALANDALAGAALDVVSSEPIEDSNPLLQAPRCILTPHMAWASLAARQRLMEATADNIRAFQAGSPIHVVNGV